MQRVKAYTNLWEKRCYKGGIPDEVPELLAKTNRVPSFKSLAICLLRNDLKLRGVGFTEAHYNAELVRLLEKGEGLQLQLPFSGAA